MDRDEKRLVIRGLAVSLAILVLIFAFGRSFSTLHQQQPGAHPTRSASSAPPVASAGVAQKSPVTPETPDEGGSSAQWTVKQVQDRLKKAGITARRDVQVSQPFMGVPARVLVVGSGEAEIQTYIYADEAARQRDTSRLDPQRVAPPTTQVTWLMQPSLVVNRDLALIVLTRDERLRWRIAKAISGASPHFAQGKKMTGQCSPRHSPTMKHAQ